MKKVQKVLLVVLFIVIAINLAGCFAVNEIALENKYEVNNDDDYIIDKKSNLGLKSLKYKGKNVYLLGYLDEENIKVDEKTGYFQSLKVGKNCISITSTVLDINKRINENIMRDILEKFNTELGGETVDKQVEKDFYIISKAEKCVIIDYLTTIPNNYNKVAYYRIIIQDISMVSHDLTEEELAILEDYLPILLKELGISEKFEMPKQGMKFEVEELEEIEKLEETEENQEVENNQE